MTRTLRRISQAFWAALFLYFVYRTATPLEPEIPVDKFVQISPLVAISAMLSSRSWLYETALAGLATILMTVLLGRVFCGWICPLGAALDASDRLFFGSAKRSGAKRFHAWKYYILAGILVSALFTMQAAYLLDPLSLLTRTVVLVFLPPIQMALGAVSNLLYDWSGSSFAPLAAPSMWLSDRMMSWSFLSGPQLYFRQALFVLAVFLAIVGLSSISRRFWCSNLCPLGALLGLFSRMPALKRSVGSSCIDCGKCARECKTGAIPAEPRHTRSAECVECFNCVPVCPRDAVSFRLRPGPESHKDTRLDLSRRRLLQGAGVGLSFAALAKVDPGRKRALADTSTIKLSDSRLIRPPGSVGEDRFVARCVRCGLCMKACPTNGLQPAIHEAGIEGFWTPILVPKIGFCSQECNACGEVCPTDAIERFEIEDKDRIFIGTAVIHRDQCIAWNSGRKCLVCDEYCSYKAIEWKTENGVRRPFVNEEKCVGCGICESACPIQPDAAIRVYSLGDRRGRRLPPPPPDSSTDGTADENPYGF